MGTEEEFDGRDDDTDDGKCCVEETHFNTL